MADTEDMNREGAETYLRLLAEATMRRSFGSEMRRYMEQRRVRAARPDHTPAR